MPNTQSAKKALRQNKRNRVTNLERKSKLKNEVKTYKKLVSAGNTEEAAKQLPKVYKALDKSAKTNVIKKNTASRLKSRLSKKIAAK